MCCSCYLLACERVGSVSARGTRGLLVSAPPRTADLSVLGKIENQLVTCQ